MNWKNLAIAAVAFTILDLVANTVGAIGTMSYYTDPANSALWSKLMMPGPAPPPAEFYLVSIIITFITGLIFAYAYVITRHAFAGKRSFRADRQWEVGAKFGVFLFLISTLPGMVSIYLLFAVPFGLVVGWIVQGFVPNVLTGVIFSKIIKSD